MADYDEAAIQEGIESFKTANERPEWDEKNYQTVLDKYDFPLACKACAPFINRSSGADPRGFIDVVKGNRPVFGNEAANVAESLDPSTLTEDQAYAAALLAVQDKCTANLPYTALGEAGGTMTAERSELYADDFESAMDYEYNLQSIDSAYQTTVAPSLIEDLGASTGELVACAEKYMADAVKLQTAIDQFWDDAKTKLFDNLDVRQYFLGPSGYQNRQVASLHMGAGAPGAQNMGQRTGWVFLQAAGIMPTSFTGTFTRLNTQFKEYPYATYTNGLDTDISNGEVQWANLDHILIDSKAPNMSNGLRFPETFNTFTKDDGTTGFVTDPAATAGVEKNLSTYDEMAAFPYLYASLMLAAVETFQDIVNRAPVEVEIVAINQGDPSNSTRQNPAYHSITTKNHGGLDGTNTPVGTLYKRSTYGQIKMGDVNSMPKNAMYTRNHTRGPDAQIEPGDRGAYDSSKVRFRHVLNAVKTQGELAKAAYPEFAADIGVLLKGLRTMEGLVYANVAGIQEGIANHSKCILDQDEQNEDTLNAANEAFNDALGSSGVGWLGGLFKDRERNAQVDQAQATLDQRSGQGDIFGGNAPEKILFREQCFLLSFVNTISRHKKQVLDYLKDGTPAAGGISKQLPYSVTGFPTTIGYGGVAPGLQNACLQVQGDPYGFINRLTQNPNSLPLYDIENRHMSALQPKIRLFKVIYDEEGNEQEIEMKFESHFSKYEMDYFKKSRARGAGVGLKSFTFTYDGSNPFAAKKSIKANLKIFANSFKELFTVRPGEATQANLETGALETAPSSSPYRFIDLALKTWSEKREPVNKDAYDLILAENADKIKLNFRLKAVVGLSHPKNNLPKTSPENQPDYTNDDLKKALTTTFVTLNLTPTVHSFDFDEQGKVILDINYLAYVEDFFDERAFNIFADPEGVLGVSRVKRELRMKKHARSCEGTEKLTSLKADFATLARREKRISLKRLLNTLSDDKKIYYLNIPLSSARQFVSLGPFANYDTIVDGDSSSFIKNESDQAQQTSNDVIQALDNYNLDEGEDSDASLNELKASLVGINPEKNYLAFFYVSDLVDVILANIEKELIYINEKLAQEMQGEDYEEDDLTLKIADLKKYKRNFTKLRVMLGPVEFAQPMSYEEVDASGQMVRKTKYIVDFVNFGDIPISIRYFAEFLADRVFKKDETVYSLTRFLNDLFNNLIDSFLNGQRCFDFDIDQKIRVNQSVLTSYSDMQRGGFTKDEITFMLEEKCQRMKSSGTGEQSTGNPTRLFLDDPEALMTLQRKGSLLNISGIGTEDSTYAPLSHEINYFVFFAARTKPADRMLGKKAEDGVAGIFHYLLGRNKGIVKNIKLQKTQTPGLQEVRFEQEGYDGLEQLRVVYDVEIETYANVKAFPGTYIYIPPEGFDPALTATLDLPPGFDMTTFGIGGYYMIYRSVHNFAAGDASTTIYAKWVQQVESEAKEQAAGRVSSEELPSKCGLPRLTKSKEQ